MIEHVYIHIPFCLRKCKYCDFVSGKDIKNKELYIQTLLSEIKSSISTNLKNIKSNTATMSEFYQAFIAPIEAMYDDGQVATCTPNDQINALLNNEKTSVAAEKYYTVYCQAIDAYGTVEDIEVLGTNMAELSSDAAAALNEILLTIEQDPFSNIRQLLTELYNDEA